MACLMRSSVDTCLSQAAHPTRQSVGIVPANRSSFSRPLIRVARTTSPVPIAPCLPLRRMRARAVSGLLPFSSRSRPWCLDLKTSRGPTGTSSREVDGADLGLFLGGALDGIEDAMLWTMRAGRRGRGWVFSPTGGAFLVPGLRVQPDYDADRVGRERGVRGSLGEERARDSVDEGGRGGQPVAKDP